ncbi:hypothetical protein [Providencia sneebia]|uniref:Fimbrial protein n=1 Tax=Providencia sneebia DSM 19967 TaxID=1141660 RepID=K8WJM0_9GAMM|nr:hypothetical protein [Providencia sneebia]EKT60171.1 hypothetical protein OO7_05069 [Providencia sneebia DSM 19967]
MDNKSISAHSLIRESNKLSCNETIADSLEGDFHLRAKCKIWGMGGMIFSLLAIPLQGHTENLGFFPKGAGVIYEKTLTSNVSVAEMQSCVTPGLEGGWRNTSGDVVLTPGVAIISNQIISGVNAYGLAQDIGISVQGSVVTNFTMVGGYWTTQNGDYKAKWESNGGSYSISQSVTPALSGVSFQNVTRDVGAIGSTMNQYVGGSAEGGPNVLSTYNSDGNLTFKIIIGPNAEPGKYSVGDPAHGLGLIYGEGCIFKVTPITFEVSPPIQSCSINAPPVVFGEFNMSEKEPQDDLLASKDIDLNVTCTYSSGSMAGASQKASISFDSLTDGGIYYGRLTHPETKQYAPAHFLGVLKDVSGAPDAGCVANSADPGRISFNNAPNASQVTIPGEIKLRFDLCTTAPDRANRRGHFKGSSTVTLNWD